MAGLPDPVQAAFAKAAREFRTTLNDDDLYNEILKTDSIDKVYAATDALQAEQRKEGRLRHLSKIQPYLERLRGYESVIDTFVQAKPDIMALIWGPIKLLLLWTSTLSKSLDAIISTTADIGELLPEFQEMATMFDQNHHLKDVMALFFQDILDFYLVALKFFKSSRWKYFFESVWPKQKERIKLVMNQVERHSTLMRNEVRLEHIREEHDARLRALEHFERTQRAIQQQEYNAIKTDVSPMFYDSSLDRIRSRTCAGTGKWLLRDKTFVEWLDASKPSTKILWLSGIPGAGKTYLSAFAIDKAMALHRTMFAFLSHVHSTSTSALSIVHSLIFQLASQDDNLQLILCQSGRKNLKNKLDAACELLHTLLNSAGPAYIIVDGVDEIEEMEQRSLLSRLIALSNDCPDTGILIGSRHEDHIAKLLESSSSVIKANEHNAGSIQAFADAWARDWFHRRDFLPEASAEVKRLLAPLASKSEGMFLYANILLRSIESLNDLEEIRDELLVLPEGLDEAYGRILRRINANRTTVSKCRDILGWISCSPTPLDIHELEQAIAVSRNPAGLGRVSGRLNPVELCGPIVEVIDDYVYFVHFTVKKYISSPDLDGFIEIRQATLNLATCCIQYLCQDHHRPGIVGEELDDSILFGDYRLHYYATTMWLGLVESYLSVQETKELPESLTLALKSLAGSRSNAAFHGGPELGDQQYSIEFSKVKSRQPELFALLSNVAWFRKGCSTNTYSIKEASSWIALDPLTTSEISRALHWRIDELMYDTIKHSDLNHSKRLQWHYGQRLYKCGFIACPSGRKGFETHFLRRSHIKTHDRPWTCNVSGCQYANIGFLSRRMRDEHLDHNHKEASIEADYAQSDVDDDEVQVLLFDLIRTDDTMAISHLLDRFRKRDLGVLLGMVDVLLEMVKLAAYSASLATMAAITKPLFSVLESRHSKSELFRILIGASIDGENIETLMWLLKEGTAEDNSISLRASVCSKALACAVTNSSTEVWREVEFWLLKSFRSMEDVRHRNPAMVAALGKEVIRAFAQCPDREQMLLKLWRGLSSELESGFHGATARPYLGDALREVADSSCSIPLAQALLQYGADVNAKRGSEVYTALHRAVLKSSHERSVFIEFLLYQGADPKIGRKTRRYPLNRPRAEKKVQESFPAGEKGAQEIAKWIGMSWSELLQKVEEDRKAGVKWLERPESIALQ